MLSEREYFGDSKFKGFCQILPEAAVGPKPDTEGAILDA